jgi:EAL domain-containing protein (putative c-di-GMP-specific phosphodiesterase class I)
MGLLQQEIQRAMESGEFVPNFQPLVDLRSGRVEGFEILARWNHPVLGQLMPSDFVPIIERYSLPIQLTSRLLKQAFAAAQSMPSHLGLSINAAPEQFRDHILSQTICALAEQTGFDLRRLTVEVTESALFDDLPLAGAIADHLKTLGIRLALDDFGTGYSSLLHLQAMPFDEIKIDRSFVASMVESHQSRKIVAAVIALGQSLGMRTVAEGIENIEQSQLLAGQGCNIGQGWLFGRPALAEELPALLAQQKHTSESAPTPVRPAAPATARSTSAASPVRMPAKHLAPLPRANRRAVVREVKTARTGANPHHAAVSQLTAG